MCITSSMNNMTDRNKVIIKRDMFFSFVFIWFSVKGQGQFTFYVIRLILFMNSWEKEPSKTTVSKNRFSFLTVFINEWPWPTKFIWLLDYYNYLENNARLALRPINNITVIANDGLKILTLNMYHICQGKAPVGKC